MAQTPTLDFPRVGTIFRFAGGKIELHVCGTCKVVRTEVRSNAAGRPGGRVWFVTTDRGEEATVTLSYYREWAREIVKPPA